MLRIQLTATEHAALEHTVKTTPDRRLRDRCQAVLMASRGRKRQAIAQDLGVHRPTIRLWLKQYQQRGIAGLQIQWAPGQLGCIPETFPAAPGIGERRSPELWTRPRQLALYGGTRHINTSLRLHTWSVNPAAIAGVYCRHFLTEPVPSIGSGTTNARRRLARGKQKL